MWVIFEKRNTLMAGLFFGAGVDLDQLKRDLKLGSQAVQDFVRDNEKAASEIDKLYRNAATAVAAYFTFDFAKNIASQVVNVRGEFQKLQIAFTTMLDSKEKADMLMAQIVDMASRTPFTLQEVAGGAKQLMAYGISASSIIPTLTRLGNVAAGVSIPIDRLILAFGQVSAKGRLMGDDLRQFTEAGIPMISELAKNFNVTEGEITKMVEAGKIGFTDVENVINNLTNAGGKFYNLMAEQSKTVSGQLSNLYDNLDKMFNKLGESNQGTIYGTISVLNSLVENYQTYLDILKVVIATYGTYKAAVLTVSIIERTRVQMALAQMASTQALTTMQAFQAVVLGKVKDAQALLNSTILANPYALAAAAVMALISALVLFANTVTGAERAAKKLNDISTDASQGADQERDKIDALVKTIRDENATREQKAIALNKLNEIMPDNLGYITEESVRTGQATKAIEAYISSVERQIKVDAIKSELLESKKRTTKGVDTGFLNTALDVITSGGNAGAGYISRMASMYADEKQYQDQLRADLKQLTEDSVNSENKVAAAKKRTIAVIDEEIKQKKQEQSSISTTSAEYSAYEQQIKKLEAEKKAITGEGDKGKAIKDASAYKEQIAKIYQDINTQKLSILDDGFEKEWQKIQVAYQAQILEINKKQDDLLISYNKGLGYKKGDKGYIEQLPEDAQAAIDKLKQLANEIKGSAELKILFGDSGNELQLDTSLDKLLESTKTYEQKRRDIIANADIEIQQLRAKGFEAEANLREQQKQSAISDLNAEIIDGFAKTSDFFSRIYAQASTMSKKTLQATIADIKQLIAYVQGDSKILPTGVTKEVANAMKSFPNELSNLYSQLNDLQDEYNRNTNYPFANIINGFKSMKAAADLNKRAMAESNTEVKKQLKSQAELESQKGMDSLAKGATEAAGAIGFVSDSLNRLAEGSGSESMKELAEQFSSISSLANQTAQGFASGGVWGAAIAALSNIVSQTIDAFASASAETQELIQSRTDFLNSLVLLSLKVKNDDYETIFGVKALEKAIESYAKAEEALQKYSEAVNKKMSSPNDYITAGDMESRLDQYEKLQDAFKKGYTELQAMSVKTKDRSGWANFWGFGDKYKSLKDYAPELWDVNGVFDIEKAKAFLETDKKINESQRKQIQNVIDLKEAYDENMELIRKDIADTFGVLGSSVTDSLATAIMNGTDAWAEFTKAGATSLETLGKKIAYELFFAGKFENLQKQLEETYGLGDTEKVGAAQMEILKNFFANIKGDMTNAQNWMEEWKKQSESAGFDIWGSTNSANAMTTAVKSVTEDTANIIAGQLGGIRYDIREQNTLISSQIGLVNSIITINTKIEINTAESAAYLKEISPLIAKMANTGQVSSNEIRSLG